MICTARSQIRGALYTRHSHPTAASSHHDDQRGPAPCRRSELFLFGDSQAFRQLGLGLEQPPAHLGLCRSGLPLHTHRANGRSRGAAAGPGQLRAAAASSQIGRLGSYCAAEDGARAPRPSALDECCTRHPPSTGSRHGPGHGTRALAASGAGAPVARCRSRCMLQCA